MRFSQFTNTCRVSRSHCTVFDCLNKPLKGSRPKSVDSINSEHRLSSRHVSVLIDTRLEGVDFSNAKRRLSSFFYASLG